MRLVFATGALTRVADGCLYCPLWLFENPIARIADRDDCELGAFLSAFPAIAGATASSATSFTMSGVKTADGKNFAYAYSDREIGMGAINMAVSVGSAGFGDSFGKAGWGNQLGNFGYNIGTSMLTAGIAAGEGDGYFGWNGSSDVMWQGFATGMGKAVSNVAAGQTSENIKNTPEGRAYANLYDRMASKMISGVTTNLIMTGVNRGSGASWENAIVANWNRDNYNFDLSDLAGYYGAQAGSSLAFEYNYKKATQELDRQRKENAQHEMDGRPWSGASADAAAAAGVLAGTGVVLANRRSLLAGQDAEDYAASEAKYINEKKASGGTLTDYEKVRYYDNKIANGETLTDAEWKECNDAYGNMETAWVASAEELRKSLRGNFIKDTPNVTNEKLAMLAMYDEGMAREDARWVSAMRKELAAEEMRNYQAKKAEDRANNVTWVKDDTEYSGIGTTLYAADKKVYLRSTEEMTSDARLWNSVIQSSLPLTTILGNFYTGAWRMDQAYLGIENTYIAPLMSAADLVGYSEIPTSQVPVGKDVNVRYKFDYQGVGWGSYGSRNNDKYAAKPMADFLVKNIQEWYEKNSDLPVLINDISFLGGGKMLKGYDKMGNPTYHKSHQMGLDADIKWMSYDGEEHAGKFDSDNNYGYYDQDKTAEFIEMLLKNKNLIKGYEVQNIYFNDPDLVERFKNVKNSFGDQLLKEMDGHSTHIHLKFRRARGR